MNPPQYNTLVRYSAIAEPKSRLTRKELITLSYLDDGCTIGCIADKSDTMEQAIRTRFMNIGQKLRPLKPLVDFHRKIDHTMGKIDEAKAASYKFGVTIPTQIYVRMFDNDFPSADEAMQNTMDKLGLDMDDPFWKVQKELESYRLRFGVKPYTPGSLVYHMSKQRARR